MCANDPAAKADAWEMSKERELIDSLLGQRFNFFLVFFALMIDGALDARSQHAPQLMIGILGMGAFVSLLLALSIGRLQKKLDKTLDQIHLYQKDHPATLINDEISSWPQRDNQIIGYWVPGICVVAAFVALILSINGKI